MADPNMSDFYRRVAKIEKARSQGYGFEAQGALGRSYYVRPKARRRSFLGPLILLAACVLVLKGLIIAEVGVAAYDQRIETLMAGEGVDRVGGWIMQREAASDWVATETGPWLARLHG